MRKFKPKPVVTALVKHNVYIVCINYNNELNNEIRHWCAKTNSIYAELSFSDIDHMTVYIRHPHDAAMFVLKFGQHIIESYITELPDY